MGLAKCYLNKALFNEFLRKERVKDVDLFYEVHFEPHVLDDADELFPHAFESERIKLKSMASLLQWNQTFTVGLKTGFEKVHIKVFMFSIVLGKVEVDAQELEVERLLPRLADQRMAKMPFVTDNGYALEVILKWRHDETLLKFVEISKRITKIRQVVDKYARRIADLRKPHIERDFLITLENATPCFTQTQNPVSRSALDLGR